MTIAFWCVFVAAALPYVPFALVKGLDPNNTRAGVKALTGRSARAHSAHLNAFEAFPPFAAAVIISHLTHGPSLWSNVLALMFLAARTAHIVFYVGDNQPARSSAFGVGMLVVVALFIYAAL